MGASINLMPLSVFKRIGLREVQHTKITFQIADRAFTYCHWIIKDILVKFDMFMFPTDFVILDMEEDHDIPIILGHPFLTIVKAAMVKALIDVSSEE